MAKSNAQIFVVRVYNEEGIHTLDGTFNDMGKDSVSFTHKKPKSSKYVTRVFPRSDVVGFTGAVGKPSTLMVKDKQVLVKVFKGSVEVGSEFVKVTQDDGVIVNVRVGPNMEMIADADTPGSDAVKTKKKSGGKKGKKSDKKGG